MMLTLCKHILGYRDSLISTKFADEMTKIGQNNAFPITVAFTLGLNNVFSYIIEFCPILYHPAHLASVFDEQDFL